MQRPNPLDFKSEQQFLDAVARYVKHVTAANKAYGAKIDRATDHTISTTSIHRKAPINNRPVKTFHDMLNENPVLRSMHRQGRLF